jgi:hypothetical protein
MAVLVDSNVILDVATNDPTWCEWSSRALARAADESVLVINPIVFAEVSVGFDRVEDLEDALPPEIYRRGPCRTRRCSSRGGASSRTAGAEGAA